MEYLRATSDDEMETIGPNPPDCGSNPGSPARELCVLGWNAAYAKVNNRL